MDICMCRGDGCPEEKKTVCFRYVATPSKWLQSYFYESPIKVDNSCDYYWKVGGGSNEQESD